MSRGWCEGVSNINHVRTGQGMTQDQGILSSTGFAKHNVRCPQSWLCNC